MSLSCPLLILFALKVGSCPNNDNLSNIFSVLFCVAFKKFYFLNLFLPKKPQDFAENSPFFVFFYFLCVGISILKIVMSRAHKWVSSDVIL